MELHGGQIIAGELVGTGTGARRARSPINDEELPVAFLDATEGETDAAVVAAGEAFRAFRGSSPAERSALLRRIADEIEALGDQLIDRCHLETGLPSARLVGERGRTCGQLRLFADVLDEGSWVDARITTALPDRTPVPRPDLRRMLVALGPVVVFGASNFPLAFSVAGGDTASALAAGCPVIVKAHSSHPGTSELVGRAVAAAVDALQLPAGVFSMLHGPGRSVGTQLVTHPLVTAVGFTGSYSGGRALHDAAASRPKPIPVYAEMGSINPVFLLPGAAQERGSAIAEGLTGSVTLGVGQFCTNPGLVAGISGKEFEAFAQATGRAISVVEAGVMLNRRIQAAYEEGVGTLRKKGQVEELALGKASSDPGSHGQSALFRTSAASLLSDRSLSEEVFGPSTVLVAAENREELLRVAEDLVGHLTCTVHATEEDLAEYADLLAILQEKAGRIILNGYPTGVEVSHAMTHGGPFPATTDPHFTSVGTAAILRFARPVTWQDFPDGLLPEELRNANPAGIMRLVDGVYTREPVGSSERG